MSFTEQNKPLFALVDCNNFYVSCERVFNPSLRGQPVVVLSNNDGCVIARSQEAKQLGIVMGAPAFQCKPLLQKQNVQVFSSNYALYGDMSRRVMQTLTRFASDIQVYSIDEAFLKFEATDGMDYGKQIKSTVLQWTGIPVSLGIAPTKTLSKVANHHAKKSKEGVFVLVDSSVQETILRALPVQEVWGIGRKISEFFKHQGIVTAWQFRNADDTWIKKHLNVTGLRTAWELRGTCCLELEEMPSTKKSIMSSKSFGKPLVHYEDIAEALASYTARAAEKMRQQGCLASFLEVFLTTGSHYPREAFSDAIQFVLLQPTDYTPELIHRAKEGLRRIFCQGPHYKKTGVLLGGFVPNHSFQPDLFVNQEISLKKREEIMQLLDQTNQRFGRGKLRLAAGGDKASMEDAAGKTLCAFHNALEGSPNHSNIDLFRNSLCLKKLIFFEQIYR